MSTQLRSIGDPIENLAIGKLSRLMAPGLSPNSILD